MEHLNDNRRLFTMPLQTLSRGKRFCEFNNYMQDDYNRLKENQQRQLDELVDQGVFSETEVDVFKRQGEIDD